jgi:hypothetical protein
MFGASFVVMADLVALTYVSPTSFDEATTESIIGYNYSVNMAPVLLKVKKGTLLEDSQSFSAGVASSSTSYQATTSSQAPFQFQDDDYDTTTLVKFGKDVASSFYRFHTNLGAVEKKGDQFIQAIHQKWCPVYGLSRCEFTKVLLDMGTGSRSWVSLLDKEANDPEIAQFEERVDGSELL